MDLAPDASFGSSIPFDTNRIGAVAVSCSDGRFGEQVDEFLHVGRGLPRYDRLAVPGGPACMAGHFRAYRQEEGIVEHLKFLIEVHRLQRVVLIAHQGCAFYLEFLEVHELDLLARQCADLRAAGRRVQAIDSRLVVETWFAVRQGPTVVFRPLSAMLAEMT